MRNRNRQNGMRDRERNRQTDGRNTLAQAEQAEQAQTIMMMMMTMMMMMMKPAAGAENFQ